MTSQVSGGGRQTRLGQRLIASLIALLVLAFVVVIGARVLASRFPGLDIRAREVALEIAPGTTLTLRAHPVYPSDGEGTSVDLDRGRVTVSRSSGELRQLITFQLSADGERLSVADTRLE